MNRVEWGKHYIVIIFWDYFEMFYQVSLSPQVKRNTILTNEHGIYKLPLELPNNSRLEDIRKYQESLKNFIEKEASAQSSSKMKNVFNTRKTFLKNRNWSFLVLHYFRRKLEFVSNILSMIVVNDLVIVISEIDVTLYNVNLWH